MPETCHDSKSYFTLCLSAIRFRLTRETKFCCRGHFRNWDEILGCNGEDFSERLNTIIYIYILLLRNAILFRLNRISFVSSHANLPNFPFRERIRRIGKSNALNRPARGFLLSRARRTSRLTRARPHPLASHRLIPLLRLIFSC